VLTAAQLGPIKLKLEAVEQWAVFFGELHGVAFSQVFHDLGSLYCAWIHVRVDLCLVDTSDENFLKV
jgi:hypothetical protein